MVGAVGGAGGDTAGTISFSADSKKLALGGQLRGTSLWTISDPANPKPARDLVRVSIVVQFRVIDPRAAIHAVDNYEERIYGDVQLAARRSLALMTLDVILTNPPFGTKGAGQVPTRDDFTIEGQRAEFHTKERFGHMYGDVKMVIFNTGDDTNTDQNSKSK